MDQKITALFEEYRGVSNMREGYMHAYTSTNFYLGVLLAVLWAGVKWKIEESFLIIPFLILIQYAIVQWNQYHHFLAEEYLVDLENRINTLLGLNRKDGMDYFNYYKALFNQTLIVKDRETLFPLIKPTAFLSVFLSIFNLSVLIFSTIKGYLFIELVLGKLLGLGFVFLIIILSILLLYNFILLPKRTRPLLHRILKKQD